MRDRKSFRLHLGLLCATALALVAPPALPQSQAKTTDWPSYAADLAGTRYRPLDQINASNFNDLEIAWRIKTDNFGDRPEYKLEGTPLMVNGVLYATNDRLIFIGVAPGSKFENEDAPPVILSQESQERRGAVDVERRFGREIVEGRGCQPHRAGHQRVVQHPLGAHALVTSAWILAPLALVAGFLIAPALTALSLLVTHYAPARYATEAFTWMSTCIVIGVGAGMAVGGQLVDAVGPWAAFASAAGAGVVAAIVSLPLRQRSPG